ncbi:hypothetical protein VM1G_11484 [Cytospora mali]|uniref:Uncharacterized protein n=1 Tax=Cytospora mali TaxID=578113 RepID=A0A194VVL6_CYTMA|nr:hypothetical protein VM1G_11484 [Valsa mali]
MPPMTATTASGRINATSSTDEASSSRNNANTIGNNAHTKPNLSQLQISDILPGTTNARPSAPTEINPKNSLHGTGIPAAVATGNLSASRGTHCGKTRS